MYQGIFNASLLSRFSRIPGYGTAFEIPSGNAGYQSLHGLPDGPMKTAVLTAFADSFSTGWIVGCSFILSALVVSEGLRVSGLPLMGVLVPIVDAVHEILQSE